MTIICHGGLRLRESHGPRAVGGAVRGLREHRPGTAEPYVSSFGPGDDGSVHLGGRAQVAAAVWLGDVATSRRLDIGRSVRRPGLAPSLYTAVP